MPPRRPINARSRILSAKTYAAVVAMARCDPAIAATSDQWDSDPLLLNCDGESLLLDSDPAPRSRRLFHQIHRSRPEHECPIWLEFLKP